MLIAAVQQGYPSHPHAIAALLFVVFWVLSQDKAQQSWSGYLYRTIPVVIYFTLTMGDHGRRITGLEWWAGMMVIYHFFSVVFLIGASMKRGSNGSSSK